MLTFWPFKRFLQYFLDFCWVCREFPNIAVGLNYFKCGFFNWLAEELTILAYDDEIIALAGSTLFGVIKKEPDPSLPPVAAVAKLGVLKAELN